MPGGKKGCAPKLMVRLVTAVPIGTPGRSSALRFGPLKKITLRALATATSMLKMVASGIRFRASSLPSKSATAITKLARVPSVNRTQYFISVIALCKLVVCKVLVIITSRRQAGRPIGLIYERERDAINDD